MNSENISPSWANHKKFHDVFQLLTPLLPSPTLIGNNAYLGLRMMSCCTCTWRISSLIVFVFTKASISLCTTALGNTSQSQSAHQALLDFKLSATEWPEFCLKNCLKVCKLKLHNFNKTDQWLVSRQNCKIKKKKNQVITNQSNDESTMTISLTLIRGHDVQIEALHKSKRYFVVCTCIQA